MEVENVQLKKRHGAYDLYPQQSTHFQEFHRKKRPLSLQLPHDP
jgi:hypothetical protein